MDKFWERVRSSDYYRGVLKNMGGPTRNSVVRFGTEGEGVAPNYEVEHLGGEKVAFRGLSHRENTDARTYAPEHLSEPYSFPDVQSMLASCLAQPRP